MVTSAPTFEQMNEVAVEVRRRHQPPQFAGLDRRLHEARGRDRLAQGTGCELDERHDNHDNRQDEADDRADRGDLQHVVYLLRFLRLGDVLLPFVQLHRIGPPERDPFVGDAADPGEGKEHEEEQSAKVYGIADGSDPAERSEQQQRRRLDQRSTFLPHHVGVQVADHLRRQLVGPGHEGAFSHRGVTITGDCAADPSSSTHRPICAWKKMSRTPARSARAR